MLPRKVSTALVDADIIAYSCGFAVQETTYQTEDGELFPTLGKAKKHIEEKKLDNQEVMAFVEAEPLRHALQLCKNLLLRVHERLQSEEMELYLTGVDNFRDTVATIRPYKGNRVAAKPLHYADIRKYLIEVWEATVIDGMEADDALGIKQTEDSCIVTIDKDLNMIPGMHYNWRTDKVYEVTELEALRTFYLQLLTGDTTDNIPGVPGIGTARADKLLRGKTDEEEMYWIALCTYATQYAKPYEAMLENARLLWILRSEEEQWTSKF